MSNNKKGSRRENGCIGRVLVLAAVSPGVVLEREGARGFGRQQRQAYVHVHHALSGTRSTPDGGHIRRQCTIVIE